MLFLYDATGLYGFQYGGNTYFYLYNGQGDVMGLVNTQGTQVVSYTYDAWGKPLATIGTLADTVGAVNPIRYRGYYYDAESGLYYFQSRYYDPAIGRFLNADGIIGANVGAATYNLYSYCGNNPINYGDPSGAFVFYYGMGADATLAIGLNVAWVQAYDTYGNWSSKLILGIGGGVLNLSAGHVFGFIWGADTVDDIDGLGVYAGFSCGPIGVRLLWGNKSATPIGIQISAQYSKGSEFNFSVGLNYTFDIINVNMRDLLEEMEELNRKLNTDPIGPIGSIGPFNFNMDLSSFYMNIASFYMKMDSLSNKLASLNKYIGSL